MAKERKRIFVRGRLPVQLFFAALTNSYVTGFAAGKIYQGDLKQLCHPGLNCYSCPGALLSCPIGALQAVIGSRAFNLSLYVFGFLLLVGATLGRMVCGFLCPFGMIQELLHKIPFPKKLRTFRGDRPLRGMKYLMLFVLVVLLPLILTNPAGEASPYFCKLVCPAGALEGAVPLVLFQPASAGAQVSGGGLGLTIPIAPTVDLIDPASASQYNVGTLFYWKMSLLAAVILLSVVLYRPFCKYLCPLGAVYGALNPVSLYRLRLDKAACIQCGACKRACGMALDPIHELNHAECVRCGDCVNVCPVDALSMGFGNKKAGRKEKAPQGGKQA